MEILLYIIVGLVLGLASGYGLLQVLNTRKMSLLNDKANEALDDARKEAATIIKEARLEAKEELLKAWAEFERKAEERKKEFIESENRFLTREKGLDRKIEQAERREREIYNKERQISETRKEFDEKAIEIEKLKREQTAKLEEIACMTRDEAKNVIKEQIFGEARMESLSQVKRIEEEAKNNATEKANYIIAGAIQRCANDHVAENTVSVVDLPNDEMKGRIIGREGRNIRALEVATGVDLIIDDTPNAVILSCFDPIKREVARQTLEKLIGDGRIHPGRIEDTVDKITKKLNNQLRETGEKACFELGIEGVHPEIAKILGKLKYRTSYSQNVLHHSIEVSYLCGMMAGELKQDVKLARRAGLFHDIGKAIDQTMEGTHTQIGVELARRYNEPKVVLNSIASHHEDVPPESVIAVLVAAADALSASRPGARREMLQNYINRMEKLEAIGSSFKGVSRTYAIQAGREVRVVVTPDAIRDSEAFFLAKDIAKKIEGELAYPGEIKVTVIRETRVTDFAR